MRIQFCFLSSHNPFTLFSVRTDHKNVRTFEISLFFMSNLNIRVEDDLTLNYRENEIFYAVKRVNNYSVSDMITFR